MDNLFLICSLLCIAAYVQISLQAGNFQLQENANPDVNCLLFGNIGCNSTCALIGKLFVEGGEGTCNESFTCDCKLYQPTSIDDIWFTKFDRDSSSESLLHQLKTFQKYLEDSAYTTALNTMKDPFLTNKKAIKLMTDLLPTSNLSNSIKPSNNQLISTYVDDIDNFNEKDATKLSAFVKSELSTIPENITDEIAKNDYKERMNEFVNKVNDKVTISYVTKQLEMISGSPFITQILKKLEGKKGYSSSNDTRSENEEEEKSSKKVTNAIAAFVTSELMNHFEKNQKSQTINTNKPSQSNTFKEEIAIPDVKLMTDLLPTSNLSNSIKPSNNQLISTYVDDIDNFNEKNATKLSAFVKPELSTIPENTTDEIAKNDYKEQMNEFVNKVYKDTISFVTQPLEMIFGSPFITQILKKLEGIKEYSSSNDTRSENEEEEKSSKKVIDAIAAFVNKSLPNININIQKYEDRDSFSDIDKGKCSTLTANKTNSKYSSSQWKPSVRAISNTAVKHGGVKREWEGSNSYIKYSKDLLGTLTINWQSGDVTITLKNTYMGDVNQTWKFGDIEISLNNDYMGNIDHKWNFGKTQYILSKSFMGDQSVGWTGVEDFDTLCEYKNYISSWCSQNTDLFSNRCVLFTY